MLTVSIDNSYQLQSLFEECGRGEHFSPLGYDALYNYLEKLSDDIGDIHIDVISLCCDYREYSCWQQLYDEYSYAWGGEGKEWRQINQATFKKWVHAQTQVIEHEHGIIIAIF